MLCEELNAGDFLFMSETYKGLMSKFRKWKDSFETKGVKLNLG